MLSEEHLSMTLLIYSDLGNYSQSKLTLRSITNKYGNGFRGS